MSKLTEVRVPDIGDFKDVEVIEVLVSQGDTVQAEDPLITLESDKATMDVPSPVAGTIAEVKIATGNTVSEGTLIMVVEEAEGGEAPTAAADKDESAPEPAARPEPVAEPAPTVEPAPAPAPVSGPGEAQTGRDDDDSPQMPARRPPPSLPPPVEKSGTAGVHASPSLRRFARELGVDLSLVRGSGPKGRILKDDVQGFVKESLARPAAAAGAGIPAMPEIDFSKFGDTETVDLPRIKRISGPHLHRAWLNVPHVTHHDEADITALEDFRQSLKQETADRGLRITMLAFILKASAATLRAFPRVNSSLTPDAQRLVLKKYCHIGMAVDTPNGLVVPVLRDVDRKGIYELAAEMGEVSKRARDGKLKAQEMQGGCFSISSLGGIGGTAFTPIVNAPEVAILGVTRARMMPVWRDGEFVPRLMLPLDLSYDHRVIDGAEAARFVAYLCRVLEDARRLLL